MNEIRHIHLGRQSYTIAADAYKELHEYLEAIRRKAGKEVVEEVELRFAELLTERGIAGEKVVLAADISYIKEQLGTPTDFSDDADDEPIEQYETAKRLYRDTDNAMVAGVAAGLGKYFGIDPLIIRIIFVALTFAGAAGVLIYLLLWILVPEAKTNSDRLRMQGLPVNVDTIKHAIARADIEGAAHRATSIVGGAINRLFYVLLALVGAAFIVGGLGMILLAATLMIYGLIRGVQADSSTVFPVGGEQVALVVCAFVVVALVATMVITAGLTLIKRKWRMPAWATVGIIGMFIVAASAGVALTADSVPRIRDRYESFQHSSMHYVEPVQRIHIVGHNAFYQITEDNKTGVEIRTFGTVDTTPIQITRDVDGVLTVDTTNFHPQHPNCQLICPYGEKRTMLVIHLPRQVPIDAPNDTRVILNIDNYSMRDDDQGSNIVVEPPVPALGPKAASGN